MAVTPLKAFLFAGGGLVAATGVAYVSGALDPYFNQPPAEVAALAPPAAPEAPAEVSPGTGVHDVTPPPAAAEPEKPADQASIPPADNDDAAAPAEPAAPATDAMKPAAPNPPQTDAMKPAAPAAEEPAKPAEAAAPATPPAAAGPVVPTFDLLRVEPDGSLVVAGNAAPNARVEILSGAAVIGSTTAGPDGAFAIVLDNPLKPGDYQLTLRATTPDNVVVASGQTAVVSVPEKPDGQVLAMVEEPGKPAELMTVPEPAKQPEPPPAAAEPAPAEPAPADAAAEPTPAPAEAAPPAAEQPPAAVEAQPAPAEPQAPAAPAAEPKVTVEAVEIDGDKIFVAGLADPGRKVRAYANEILLGDAVTSPDGHFLVEATHDLPVGTYTVRVDALDADGAKVVARATVPFEREPGESIAAVAPAEPARPAEQPAEIAAAQPAEVASEPAAPPAQAEPPAPAEAAAPPASGSAEAPPSAGGEKPPATAEAPAPQPAEPAAEPPAVATAPGQPAAPAPEKPAEVAAAAPPGDGVPETVSPKLEHSDGAVIIRRRDTLWRISRRVYGHGIRYSTIYLANQDQIADPDMIWPGQVFRVPEKSKEGEPANLKAMGDQATTKPPKTE